MPGTRTSSAAARDERTGKANPGGDSDPAKAGTKEAAEGIATDPSDEDLRELVKQMGRLLIRLEDAQTIANLDTSFIMFVGATPDPAGWSLPSSMYQIALDWNRRKESDPGSLKQPLRVVLLHAFLEVLYTKIVDMETNQDLRERARELGLVVDLETAPAYPYLRWDSQQKKHVAEERMPLSHEDAKVTVKMLQNLTACPNVIGRFHALHKLAPQYASEVIPFSLQIQNRNAESQQMYLGFLRLSRNGVMQLCNTTLRPTRMGRSPLAVQIDKTLQSM